MRNQKSKNAIRKRKNHRAGAKTRAARAASHLRWLERKAKITKPRIKSIETVCLSPGTVCQLKASTRTNTGKSLHKELSNYKSNCEEVTTYVNQHNESNDSIESYHDPQSPDIIFLAEFCKPQDSSSRYTSKTSPSEDLISQLISQLPDDPVIIDEYDNYLNY